MIKCSRIAAVVSLSAAMSIAAFTSAQAADVPAGVQLAAKQVLVKNNGAEPGTLDPQKVEGVPASNISLDLFVGLTLEAPDGSIVPGVAKSWSISKNHLVYTFHLRKDARWSNGKPVTAEDFVYGMRRGVDPKLASAYAYFLYPIKNAKAINDGKLPLKDLAVKALDAHTLQITLNEPAPYFLQVVSQPTTFPAYKPSIEKWGNKFTQPGHLVSNGAYELKSWVVNGHITLVKNPYYWDAKHVVIKEVKYLPIVDSNTSMQMVESGQSDWTYTIPSSQYKTLKAKYGSQIVTKPYLGLYYYDLNMQKPPFKGSLALRKALSLAVDRVALTKYVLGQGQIPAYNFVPKGTAGINFIQYGWSDWSNGKRIAEAQKLYKEAGYSKANPLKITILYNTNADHKKIALALASMWKQALGVQVSLENEEWKVFLKDRQEGNFVVARDGWIGDYDYATTFTDLFRCGVAQNNSHYCNTKYDALVKKAASSDSEAQRVKLYTEAERMAMNDYPIIPIFQYVALHFRSKNLRGYVGNPLDHNHSADWYFVKN